MSRQLAVQGLGVSYQLPPGSALGARMAAADKPGEHLWVVGALWAAADPERPGPALLDAENLLEFAGPGCFKCEREYSRKLAKMPCTGSLG